MPPARHLRSSAPRRPDHPDHAARLPDHAGTGHRRLPLVPHHQGRRRSRLDHDLAHPRRSLRRVPRPALRRLRRQGPRPLNRRRLSHAAFVGQALPPANPSAARTLLPSRLRLRIPLPGFPAHSTTTLSWHELSGNLPWWGGLQPANPSAARTLLPSRLRLRITLPGFPAHSTTTLSWHELSDYLCDLCVSALNTYSTLVPASPG